jgi:hypothetical protein
MARIETTMRKLFELRQDINLECRRSPAFGFFNRARVERFFKDNALQLQRLETQVNFLIGKYVMHDANNQPMTYEINGEPNYKFLTDDLREAYLKELNAFLEKPTFITD